MQNIPRQKHIIGVIAAAVAMGGIFGVALLYGPQASPRPGAPTAVSGPSAASETSATPEPWSVSEAQAGQEAASVAFRSGPDLDGDGKPDGVHAGPEGLLVTGGNGTKLLDFGQAVSTRYVVARVGGDLPVLFAETRAGEYAAFAYVPGTGLMQAVTWPDGQVRGHGQLTDEGALLRTVAGEGGARQELLQLRLNQLQLEVASAAPAPAAAAPAAAPPGESAVSPAQLLAATVEAVAAGGQPPHFAAPELAQNFAGQWQGRLPTRGRATVAMADQVNAGAENGHIVPVTVWVAGEQVVTGLKGEATFVQHDGAYRIVRLDVAPVELAVRAWEDAARRLRHTHPKAGDARRAGAPFYGVFRFETARGRFAVDAVTGKIEAE